MNSDSKLKPRILFYETPQGWRCRSKPNGKIIDTETLFVSTASPMLVQRVMHRIHGDEFTIVMAI